MQGRLWALTQQNQTAPRAVFVLCGGTGILASHSLLTVSCVSQPLCIRRRTDRRREMLLLGETRGDMRGQSHSCQP